MSRMIAFYNRQVQLLYDSSNGSTKKAHEIIDSVISNDPKMISWSRGLRKRLAQFNRYQFSSSNIVRSSYRPFCKQWLYFDRVFNEMGYKISRIFPVDNLSNLVITVTGVGASKGFSCLITDNIPNYHFHDTAQHFPLYYFEKYENKLGTFPSFYDEKGYKKIDAIDTKILSEFKDCYDSSIKKEDIFYYVYGILHSSEYKSRFESDLKKMIPHIPFAKDFWAFSKAGRDLAHWHLHYETVEPFPLVESCNTLILDPKKDYYVHKMIFGRKGKELDKTTIHYNSNIKLSGIPLESYEYIVNGKPAIEWIMERYQVVKDKDSVIINDPNDWSDDPRYIIDLVKRIVRISIETIKIVNSLPLLSEIKR